MSHPVRPLLLGAIAALLLALCAGAIWSVVALIVVSPVHWMVIPAVAVAVAGSDFLRAAPALSQAAAAAAMTIVSTLYAHYLSAASLVAGVLGIEFQDALTNIGAEMALALSLARTEPWPAAGLLLAPLLAALLVLWRRKRRATARGAPQAARERG